MVAHCGRSMETDQHWGLGCREWNLAHTAQIIRLREQIWDGVEPHIPLEGREKYLCGLDPEQWPAYCLP